MILLGLVVSILSGFLWAYGGAEGTSKNWRRLGVPILLFYFSSLLTGVWLKPLICAVVLYIGTTLPYGIPSPQDDGGDIGKFWYFITHNIVQTNILTRATVGVFYGVIAKSPIGFIFILINTVLWGAIMGNLRPIEIDIFGWKPYINSTEFLIGLGVGIGVLL